MHCSTAPSRSSTQRDLKLLDGAIACRPIVGTLNQLAGQPDRFAPVNLDALTSALAQLAEKSSIENIGREVASNPVVLAVMLSARR
jgi:hypothetical protein